MIEAVAIGGWMVAVTAALGARKLLESRQEAVARACHELRGPLTAARLALELGLRSGGLPPARLRAIDLELGRATLALGDLGRPGLALSRTRVDVAGLVTDSAEAWRPAAARAGVELRAEWSGQRAFVWGDLLRLAQATGNVIANAIEHGGGSVEVRGRVEGAAVRIEVVDNGPGLTGPLDELARHARRRWGRGRGHGLAVAGTVAAAHGGRLAAAPSARGARLVLELPIAGEGSAELDDRSGG